MFRRRTNTFLAGERGASLIEVLLAYTIMGVAIAAGTQALMNAMSVRKATLDRSTVAGLGDGLGTTTLFELRRNIRAGIAAGAPSLTEYLLTQAKSIGKPIELPDSKVILFSRFTPVAALPTDVGGEQAFAATIRRCRAASPVIRSSTIYFCAAIVPSGTAIDGGLWSMVDSDYPIIVEMTFNPFDGDDGAVLDINAIASGQQPALRMFSQVIWVAKSTGNLRKTVRWLGKERHVPI